MVSVNMAASAEAVKTEAKLNTVCKYLGLINLVRRPRMAGEMHFFRTLRNFASTYSQSY